MVLPSAVSDLRGHRFGNLLVISYVGLTARRQAVWVAVCDCGRDVVVRAAELRTSDTKSCGCLKAAATAARNKLRSKYPNKDVRTYRSWTSMRARCLSSVCKDYPRYGGRGIAIDGRWDTYAGFLKDMGVRPSGKTLGRMDVNGGYGPANCRWETPRQQANNRTNSHTVTFAGETKTLTGWANALGVTEGAIRRRLYVYGWPAEKALTQRGRGHGSHT